ncbi:MAG TPA: NAD(P)-dependent oxidoreductase, partial [Candidatus Omnitrophota bacterium]|nr:NAD(P)-dependent oxidoreductase [Candidatus Omnitrophota bacterium]
MAGELNGKTILITGGAGMLGRAFAEVLAGYPCNVVAKSHEELDVTDRDAVMAERADVIVHCAADVNAERCEDDPAQTRRVQVDGARNVADLARATGARLFYPQSFLIFDGKHLPISEHTPPAPLSVYGRCKLEAEQVLMQVPGTIVVRMAGFFGGEEKDKNFVGLFTRKIAQLLAEGVDHYAVGDRVWQPTWTVDLARNSALLLDEGKTGLYTMSCHGEASFWELAAACVEELGIGHRMRIDKVSAAQVARAEKAKRPDRAVMDNRRLR